jgi:hypothetical protein
MSSFFGFAVAVSTVAGMQQRTMIGELANNEGIYVDLKGFKIAKGAAKGDPSTQIVKMGAREVADGAIIFRSGDKLYIVDGKPAGSAP